MTVPNAGFADAPAEGPFAFKPARDQPIGLHFDRFQDLSPEQAVELLMVRDGSLPSCVIDVPGEQILAEHAGTGYVDVTTGRAWGYTIRRRPVPSTAVAPVAPVAPVTPPPAPRPLPPPPPAPVREVAALTPAPAPPTNIAPPAVARSVAPSMAAPVATATSVATAVVAATADLVAQRRDLEDRIDALQADLRREVERSRTLDVQLAAARDEVVRLNTTIAARGAERNLAHQKLQESKAEAVRLQQEISALSDSHTADAPAEGASGPGGRQSDVDRSWVFSQKLKIEEDRLSNEAVRARLESDLRDFEARAANLMSRQSAWEAEVEHHRTTWVPGAATNGRSGEDHRPDESLRTLIRVGICWFVTLVLLVQIAMLAWEIAESQHHG
jgi:hypothetical protein